ncbi:hypothetical protein Tco_0715337 [Tanacetum coccineum]
MNIPSKEDLDNLFGPMYEEYFKKRSSETSINSATQQVHNHEDSPSTSSIIIEEHKAPLIVTTFEEQTYPISLNEADEFNQEDSTDFDGNTVFVPYDAPNFEEAESSTIALDPSNMHEFHQFGDSYKAPPEETGKGVTGEGSAKKKGRTVAIIVDDMQKWRNDVKERTTLLLALLNEHQLRFSKYDNAKELWEAILKIFGRNETTKKTKKNQLKQKYGNFKAEGSEILEQTFNRLQAIVSHLEFIDVPVKQDDLNHKFLSSLAPEWLVYIMVWRNRDDLDTMSLDDVYNHLKVYEPEVQKRAGFHCYDTVCAFIATQPNGSQIKYEDITQIDDDDIEEMDIKWNLALLSMRADRSLRSQDRGKKERYKKDPNVEEPTPKAMIAIDGIGWDWSYMAEEDQNHALVADEEEVPTEYALMAKSSSSSNNKLNEELSDCETDLYNYKRGYHKLRLDLNELEKLKKEKDNIDVKIKNFENSAKDLDCLLGTHRFVKDKMGLGLNEYTAVPPPPAQMCQEIFVKETGYPSVPKVINTEISRKPIVKYAEMYRNTSQSPKVMSSFEQEKFDFTLNETVRSSFEQEKFDKFTKEVVGKKETPK